MTIHKFSRNISWPVDMNMQMSELMMSSPHNFPFILYRAMTRISDSSYANVRLALIPISESMQNNVYSNISWYEGHIIISLGKILKS